jgi:hypothetical protein
MERCGLKVQLENHIHNPRSAKKCEGMNPHTPKWSSTLGVNPYEVPNVHKVISKVKTHWIKDFIISLKRF